MLQLTRRQFFYLASAPFVKVVNDTTVTGGWYGSVNCATSSSIPLGNNGIYTYAYVDVSQKWIDDFFTSTRELFECEIQLFLPVMFKD